MSSANDTRPKQRSPKEFQLLSVLGTGSFGDVLLAYDTLLEQEVALKTILKRQVSRKPSTVERVFAEKNTLHRAAGHPNVVTLLYTFQDHDFLYFGLEYCENGTMLDLVKQFGGLSLDCVRFYGAELLSALSHLHYLGIVHRDVKPENMLLDYSYHLKLADFGCAVEVGTEDGACTHSFAGTAEYIAPETLANPSYTSFCSDIWAYACSLYVMYFDKLPFKAETEFLTYQLIKIGKVIWPKTRAYNTRLQRLISELLVIDGQARPSAEMVKTNPFFASIDFESLHLQAPPALRGPNGIINDSNSDEDGGGDLQ